MGTLLNQSPRKYWAVTKDNVDSFLEDAMELAQKHKITISDVFEAYKICEAQRKHNLYVANGDALDEQLAGFGELIQKLIITLDAIIER